jgi:glycosyltransferase involved in cell wall biosynthesis
MPSVELSIIIATYNRAVRLRACLEALARQTETPSSFEVIVVVDGSTDETMAMLRDYVPPYCLKTISQDNAGQAAALNRGLSEAVGRYCLFLDDDILAAPELVAAHLRGQRTHEAALGVGQLALVLPDSADWYARAFATAWHARYEQLNRNPLSVTWEDCYSGNLSVPRAAIPASGAFRTNLARGFDVEFAHRLHRAGCLPVYLPDALGTQDERKSFEALSRDAELAGFAEACLYLEDPEKLSDALASFPKGRRPKALVRRGLITLRIPPQVLYWCGSLVPLPSWRPHLCSLAQNLFYWRGVRRAAKGTAQWRELTSSIGV